MGTRRTPRSQIGRRGLTAALVLTGLLVFAAPSYGAAFSLGDALSLAYETNPQLEGARAALEALDQGVAQANAGLRPTINAQSSYGIQRGAVNGIAAPFNSHPIVAGVTVTQPVFNLRTFAGIGKAISDVRAGRAQLTDAEQSVLLAAVTAYMDVVRDSQALAINQTNVKALENEYAAVQTQFKEGAVTHTDVSQVEARLARAQANEAAAERQLTASRTNFQNVIGRVPEGLDNEPAVPRLPGNKDTALALALKQNPTLLAAKATARSADYTVQQAMAALAPDVSVSGQYQYLQDAAGTNIFATKKPQTILSITGQLNVPIYQGGGEDATVRRAVDLRRQSDLAVVTAERNVRQDLDDAWKTYAIAQTVIKASQAEEAANQAAVAGVTQEQQAGERSVLDILNAQEELYSSQLSVIVAKHDRAVAAFRLLQATGQLTAKSLALNVVLKDPRIHYDENAGAWFGLSD